MYLLKIFISVNYSLSKYKKIKLKKWINVYEKYCTIRIISEWGIIKDILIHHFLVSTFRRTILIIYIFVHFTDKNNVDHELTVEVDLKKFNVPVEFGLKTNTVVKDSKLDHSANLYLHSSKDNSQYSYKVYVHPKESGKKLYFSINLY